MVTKPTRKPLTKRQTTAQLNLKRFWDRHTTTHPDLTQEKAAEIMGYKTQGAIGHYLSGRAGLNTEATLLFAKLLSVHPTAIDPEIIDLLPTTTPEFIKEPCPPAYNAPEEKMLQTFRLLDSEMKSKMLKISAILAEDAAPDLEKTNKAAPCNPYTRRATTE